MVSDLHIGINRLIGTNYPTFIIAEIGQNHQGSIDTAKILIETAKECGADCVKFQKTCITEKFNKAALQKPYLDKNSWGDTYGEHKAYLEFTDDEFMELQKFALDIGILFSATPMDLISLDFLKTIDVPFIKIGSGDSNNLPLIKAAAQIKVPIMISTGMQSLEMVYTVYDTVSKFHKNFCLLHCVSSYPTPLEDVHLNVLKLFQEKFPDIHLGYSGHEYGIDVSVAAVALGAKVIERHITLGHNLKGSDHACSLEPCEFKLMVQRIRTLETALGQPIKQLQPSEMACYEKLRKTLVLAKSVSKGHRLQESDLKIKVAEPHGIVASLLNNTIGRTVNRDMEEDDSLTAECLE